MKKIIINVDGVSFNETEFVNLENDPERRNVIEYLEEDDESALFDFICEKDANGEVVTGPTYLLDNDKHLNLDIKVDGKEVFNDWVNLGENVKISYIGWAGEYDWDDDFENVEIERNGYHECRDNVIELGEDGRWEDALVRWNVTKGRVTFDFEIPDSEEFCMDKLHFLWDWEENFLFGDDKIDATHILYGNTVIIATDRDSGEEKGWGYKRCEVHSDGEINEYEGEDED